MQISEDNYQHHRHSDTELVGIDRVSFSSSLSEPLNKRVDGEKNAWLTLPEENTIATSDDYVEITLDVRDESVEVAAMHRVNAAGVGTGDDPEQNQLGKGLEKKPSFESSKERNYLSSIQQVSRDLKRLPSLTRRPQPERFDQTKSDAMQAPKGLKFISKTGGGGTWAEVEKRFDRLTYTTNGMLPRSLFGECLGMNRWSDKEFARTLFDSLSRRCSISSNSITKEQLKEFWDKIADQSQFRIFFDIVDEDADGRITEDEVREIISLSASANKLSNILEQADEYARLIMEKLDPNNLGYIMIENLEMLLLQGQNQLAEGSEGSQILSKLLSQKLRPMYDHPLKRWYRDFHHFLLDNWQRVWVMALWIGVMGGLFAYNYVQYKNRAVFYVMGHCVCVAKGAAETLKLNMALVLLPMCRNTITWLRNNTKLGAAVPFDDNINFHKVIAVAIGIGVGIHGISHLACDFPRLVNASKEKYEPLEQFVGTQPTSYWFFLKGWEGATGVVMVILMAIAFTLASSWFRRNKLRLPKPLNKLAGFNAFWYSHHLFVIVYALLIIHGVKLFFIHEWYKKSTWMYLAIPILIYAGERLIRAFRSSIKLVKILKVTLYPGNVLALHMSKPQGFKYKSGQYIFVKCAAVSPFEWHPFSFASAPQDDYLIVHIRTIGDWTRQLKLVFSEERSATGKNGLLRADFLEGENNPIFPTVLIDGPYGSPIQEYKNYDVVLLIGLGIGATPMISVVKDIVNNVKAMEDEEDLEGSPILSLKPKQRTGSGSGHHDIKTKRAYFYWITRERGSFDWFKGVMNEVAEMDHKGVIEMHNYCTSVYEEGDARSALIAMLQKMEHAKNGVDIVSGTKVKSLFGRPNWRTVYKGIALTHPNSRVGVFYCGAPVLVQQLRHLASEFSHKTSTKFEFHEEYF